MEEGSEMGRPSVPAPDTFLDRTWAIEERALAAESTDVRLSQPAWAWGRNRAMDHPAIVAVHRVPDFGDQPTVLISVYTLRGFERGSSPVDLHLSPDDARAVAAAIVKAAR